MNIPCIGDIHLQHGSWRNGDRIAALEQVISEGLALPDLGAWVQLGDIWHANVSDEDLLIAADFIQRMADAAPVLLVLGNHGAGGYSRLLGKLRARWPIIVTEAPRCVDLALATGGMLRVAVIPYPHKAGLVAAGTAVGDVRLAAEQALDTICMGLAAELQQHDGPQLVVGHLTIAGAQASTGQPLGIERDIALSAVSLARFCECPKIFGHIHKPQAVYGAVYAGSISANDFGETELKRWLSIEFDDTASQGRIVSHPIDTARLFHVEGVLTRDDFQWRIMKGPDGPVDDRPMAMCHACGGSGDGVKIPVEGTLPCRVCRGSGHMVEWAGCDIRVRARYQQAERDVLTGARERVQRMFTGVRHFDFEPIAVPAHELRAPEVVQAHSLADKLRAWAKLTETAWSGEIERCAEQLLATEDGDVVAADVQARLGSLAKLAEPTSLID